MVPTGTFPKFTAVADSAVGFTPVPLRATVWVPPTVAVLLMVSVPADCTPRTVGLRLRMTLQWAPFASVVVDRHVDDEAMEYGAPAVTETELRLMELVPVFVKVTVWGELVVPTTTLPKATDVAETLVCAAELVEKTG